ncbi:MAG TPA: hypothetical protein VKQ31_08920 [Steroidobacteraceae bacterium]|nr:hypothetical protein [Steroidobacteraceae bacterium]
MTRRKAMELERLRGHIGDCEVGCRPSGLTVERAAGGALLAVPVRRLE